MLGCGVCDACAYLWIASRTVGDLNLYSTQRNLRVQLVALSCQRAGAHSDVVVEDATDVAHLSH